MIPFFNKNKKVDNFEAIKLREASKQLNNPYRGWYKIVYFTLRENIDWDNMPEVDDEQSLVLVFIDIGNLKKDDISGQDYNDIIRILDYYKAKDKDVILRVAYDHKGLGMEKEPTSFSIVEKHANSVVEIVNKYDNIFILQGLLIGKWGEMHSSRYMNEEYLERISLAYEKCCQSTYLSVRKPVQWRRLNKNYNKNRKQSFEKMGIFNDGIFGSDTDLGTYSNRSKEEAGYSSEWLKNEELDFLETIGKTNPCGGEVVFSQDYYNKTQPSQMKKELRKMCVTYLNSEYDKEILNRWKETSCMSQGAWSDKSMYEYVGAHLGYRFVAENVTVRKNKDDQVTVEVEIKNVGFAPIYREANLIIEIDDGASIESHIIKSGLNKICSNETITHGATFRKNRGTIKVYGMCCGKTIELANESTYAGKTEVGRLI